MVIDINEVNLENLYLYQPNYRKKQKHNKIPKKPEKRSKYYKEYQHKYYMEVTKRKRLERRGILNENRR